MKEDLLRFIIRNIYVENSFVKMLSLVSVMYVSSICYVCLYSVCYNVFHLMYCIVYTDKTELNFLGLIFDINRNWKVHINFISGKIARVIGYLHRLKFVFPKQMLFSIYNSLILPHMSYSVLVWGTQYNKIELLQKKAVRVLSFKSPIAHTEPIFKRNESAQTH